MIKTAEELKAQAALKAITRYPVHDCSICGYACGYIISGGQVTYDSGCDCVPYANIQPRSWADLASAYNLNQPENNPTIGAAYLAELNQVWKFDDVIIEAHP